MIDAHLDRRGRYGFVKVAGPGRANYLLRDRGRLAGFTTIRRGALPGGGRGTQIEEFFVLRRHRRRGVGRRAACAIFNRYPGEWAVAELRQNTPAIRFWRTVIKRVAQGGFRERRCDGMLVQRFRAGG